MPRMLAEGGQEDGRVTRRDEDLYIVIVGWDKFQHPDVLRPGRRPVWIKTYCDLLHRDDYRDLNAHQRAVLHGLWLTYASAGAHLRLNTRSLSDRIGLRVMKRDLERLYHAGYITFSASPPQATSKPETSLEERREETPPKGSPTRPASKHDTHYYCKHPECGGRYGNFESEQRARDHLKNVHWLEADEADEFVGRPGT